MSVKLIQGARKTEFPAEIDAMFRLRKLVFADRLGWNVNVRNGWEIDVYDDADPLYLVACDHGGVVRGSLRLMPTTGPTLLTDVFARSFSEPVDVRSASVWEGTRFCVQPDEENGSGRGSLNQATVELFVAMCEVSLMAGLSHIVGVYDPRLVRIYRRIGWSPEPLAESHAFPHGPIYVGLWDVSEEALALMQARNGLTCSVLETGSHTIGVEAA